jgi:hypothetical protein
MYVHRNDYYTRINQDICEFRGVPLIDSDMFLEPVKIDLDIPAEDLQSTFPFATANFKEMLITVVHEPESVEGTSDKGPQCPDFVLCSPACALSRAYPVVIGSTKKPEIIRLFFNSCGSVGSKRKANRTNWEEEDV